MAKAILLDKSWYRLTAVINFCVFNRQKKNSTQHRLFWGFRADKPFESTGQAAEFKIESKFEPLQVIWQALLKAIPEDNQRLLTAKSMAELSGQCSGTPWAGQTG